MTSTIETDLVIKIYGNSGIGETCLVCFKLKRDEEINIRMANDDLPIIAISQMLEFDNLQDVQKKLEESLAEKLSGNFMGSKTFVIKEDGEGVEVGEFPVRFNQEESFKFQEKLKAKERIQAEKFLTDAIKDYQEQLQIIKNPISELVKATRTQSNRQRPPYPSPKYDSLDELPPSQSKVKCHGPHKKMNITRL